MIKQIKRAVVDSVRSPVLVRMETSIASHRWSLNFGDYARFEYSQAMQLIGAGCAVVVTDPAEVIEAERQIKQRADA